MIAGNLGTPNSIPDDKGFSPSVPPSGGSGVLSAAASESVWIGS